jgi:hypothetical protein
MVWRRKQDSSIETNRIVLQTRRWTLVFSKIREFIDECNNISSSNGQLQSFGVLQWPQKFVQTEPVDLFTRLSFVKLLGHIYHTIKLNIFGFHARKSPFQIDFCEVCAILQTGWSRFSNKKHAVKAIKRCRLNASEGIENEEKLTQYITWISKSTSCRIHTLIEAERKCSFLLNVFVSSKT